MKDNPSFEEEIVLPLEVVHGLGVSEMYEPLVSGIDTQFLRDIRGYDSNTSKMLEYSNRIRKNRPDPNTIFQEYIESSGSENFRLLLHSRRGSSHVPTNSDPKFWLLAQ